MVLGTPTKETHSMTPVLFQTAVERLAETRPFPVVEDYIDSLTLTPDQKSALWLLAWSYQPRETQREVVMETLYGPSV